MASIFTKIIKGEIPSYKVAEDEKHYAFLDINPMMVGHTLVVPKVEIDYIYELEDEVLAALNVFAKNVALAIEQVLPCKRVGVMVIGTEVPHAHIHLLPFQKESQFNITAPRVELSKEEMQATALKIHQAFLKD